MTSFNGIEYLSTQFVAVDDDPCISYQGLAVLCGVSPADIVLYIVKKKVLTVVVEDDAYINSEDALTCLRYHAFETDGIGQQYARAVLKNFTLVGYVTWAARFVNVEPDFIQEDAAIATALGLFPRLD